MHKKIFTKNATEMGGTQDVTQPQWPMLPRLSEKLHLGEYNFIYKKHLRLVLFSHLFQ